MIPVVSQRLKLTVENSKIAIRKLVKKAHVRKSKILIQLAQSSLKN